jgi:HD superfamily phosphohydrolase
MYFDKRLHIATVSLTIAGLSINRIWDRLAIVGSIERIALWFVVILFLVALTLYLVGGIGNDLLIMLFGRKHLRSVITKILSQWLESEQPEPEFFPQSIIEEKALSKVRNVWGLKKALSDHFLELEKERDKLHGEIRRADLETKRCIDDNDHLRDRFESLKTEYSEYKKERESRVPEPKQPEVGIAGDEGERVPRHPQQAPVPVLRIATTENGAALLQSAKPAWLEPISVPREPKRLPDPIYGLVSLDKDVAYIFGQPIVQRLNRIRQLSFSYLSFPSATHTRLAHSLGMCRNAEVALSGIFSRDTLYSDSGTPKPITPLVPDQKALIRKCKIAALLHDLGHGPFGHALDKYIGFLEPNRPKVSPDKDYSIKYIRKYLVTPLRDIGLDVDTIVKILDKKSRVTLAGWDVLIADLIDSPLDVDRMDYLVRDGAMTGLFTSAGSIATLMEMMRPFESNGAVSLTFDVCALPAIENILYLRDFMYVNCYELPEKLAAERSFERVVEEAVSSGLLGVDQLMLFTDEEVLDSLLSGCRSRPSIEGLIESLLRNISYEEVFACKPSDSANPEIHNWVRYRLMGSVGGGLKQAYVVLPRVWERRIAEEAGIGGDNDWQVLLSVPSYHAYVQKESGARILMEKNGKFGTEDLFNYSQRLGAILEQMRPASAYVRVFASQQLSALDRDRVKAAAQAILGPEGNQRIS